MQGGRARCFAAVPVTLGVSVATRILPRVYFRPLSTSNRTILAVPDDGDSLGRAVQHEQEMKRIIVAFLAVSIASAVRAEAPGGSFVRGREYWRDYGKRIGIVVMAGNVDKPGPHYGWYWGDTSGMTQHLLDIGFPRENVFFLSYGPKAKENAALVHGPSTTDSIRATFKKAAELSGPDDLVYLYWIDHGNDQVLETYDGYLPHNGIGELNFRSLSC